MKCPYYALPDRAFWRRSVGRDAPDVDLVLKAQFTIAASAKVATAGSCFAQHISSALSQAGFRYFVTEDANEFKSPDVAAEFGYGVFSARFGNIYTTRQLNQLFDRAFGHFVPVEPFWNNGRHWVDPFRPFIQPNGFFSLEEAIADRETHFRAVRSMFCETDIFIFTLGLTETWESREDGAVFPVCPGCGVGDYDPERYRFVNFSAGEVSTDLQAFIAKLKAVNPAVKILLTVSPVPLIATMEDRSVVVSTSYSKAALRVAAEEAARLPDVAYFPSYEIITSNYTRGENFAEDWREVTSAGVQRVMAQFLGHYCTQQEATVPQPKRRRPTPRADVSERLSRIVCDEERLEQFSPDVRS